MAVPLNLAVVGSRGFRDYELMCKTIDALREKCPVGCIISGGAYGADQLAERYARQHQISLVVMKPDWQGPLGRGAGLARNTDIVAQADYVMAFWDGKSTGTRDTMRKTEKSAKRLQTVRFIASMTTPSRRKPAARK